MRASKAALQIEQEIDAWTMRQGMIRGAEAIARMQAARFGWLAGNYFSEATVSEAVLYGKWFVWLLILDDQLDDGAGKAVPEAVDSAYAHALASEAFNQLWQETSPRVGPHWRQRFLAHIDQHRQACVQEARNRGSHRFPAPSEYVALRRHSNAPFLFDLPEAILNTEIPDPLYHAPAWQTLVQGSSDVSAWCNDIASAAKEQAQGDVNNYVLVLAHTHNVSMDEAASLVADRITERCADMQAAAPTIPDLCVQSGMNHAATGYACRVACAYLGFPRAHLDWVLTSARYH